LCHVYPTNREQSPANCDKVTNMTKTKISAPVANGRMTRAAAAAYIGAPAANCRMNRACAAAYIGVAAPTLATWATRGGGPPFLKVGAKVVYLQTDLDHWMAARRISCTAEL
jgi:hypothetical protein